MVERFFLDGVYVHRARVSVDQAVIFSVPVLPHPAESPLPGSHEAFPRTELALYSLVAQGEKIGRELGSEEAFLFPLGQDMGRDPRHSQEE
jgi:hypothetical protein